MVVQGFIHNYRPSQSLVLRVIELEFMIDPFDPRVGGYFTPLVRVRGKAHHQ